jgi:hypothetical protein
MKLTREERGQLTQTLRTAKANRSFDSALVRDMAGSAGVSERCLYSLARDGVPACSRAPWQLTERAIELYYEKRAKIPAVHHALVAAGEDVPALRQLQRGFATQLDRDERAFVRAGAAARHASPPLGALSPVGRPPEDHPGTGAPSADSAASATEQLATPN